jgi:hypothetical protein
LTLEVIATFEFSGAAAVCRVRCNDGLGGAELHSKANGVTDFVATMRRRHTLLRIRRVLGEKSGRLSARLAVQVANRSDLATVHRQMCGLVISQ